MPLPSLVVSGQVIASAHINAIRNYLPLMADGTAGTPGLRFEDDPDTGLHRPGSNQLAIVTGGAVRVTVDGSGNVGVGGAPSDKVDVVGAIRVRGNTGVGGPSSGVLDFYTGDTRLISSGADTSTLGGFKFISVNSNSTVAVTTLEISPTGVIQMLLGGTLKTLSVDGSGFVKAT